MNEYHLEKLHLGNCRDLLHLWSLEGHFLGTVNTGESSIVCLKWLRLASRGLNVGKAVRNQIFPLLVSFNYLELQRASNPFPSCSL